MHRSKSLQQYKWCHFVFKCMQSIQLSLLPCCYLKLILAWSTIWWKNLKLTLSCLFQSVLMLSGCVLNIDFKHRQRQSLVYLFVSHGVGQRRVGEVGDRAAAKHNSNFPLPAPSFRFLLWSKIQDFLRLLHLSTCPPPLVRLLCEDLTLISNVYLITCGTSCSY